MKFVLLTLAFIHSAFAVEIELNKQQIDLGTLPVAEDGLATQTLTVSRTMETPDHVSLSATFSQEYLQCTRYVTTREWIPGDFAPECNERRCTPGGRPGFWSTVKTCVETTTAHRQVKENIALDFDQALTLQQGEKETFLLNLKQKAKTSTDFNLQGKSTNSRNAYNVSQKKNKNKLKFIAE